jgi:hypothetical protein
LITARISFFTKKKKKKGQKAGVRSAVRRTCHFILVWSWGCELWIQRERGGGWGEEKDRGKEKNKKEKKEGKKS